VERISGAGGTALVVAYDQRALGVIYLKDIVKGGMRERFAQLRAMGIKSVMITGDNPLTAQTIANEAGVDDYLAQATPEDKMKLIKDEQAGGKLVAMSAASLLRRNLFIYGFGGLVAPLVGIKIVDVIIHVIGLA